MIFLKPWRALQDEAEGDGVVRELRLEVSDRHALARLPLRAIARREDDDDVLVETLDGSGRLAVVHLTWGKHPEPFCDFPLTTFYSSWKHFEQVVMRAHHDGIL